MLEIKNIENDFVLDDGEEFVFFVPLISALERSNIVEEDFIGTYWNPENYHLTYFKDNKEKNSIVNDDTFNFNKANIESFFEIINNHYIIQRYPNKENIIKIIELLHINDKGESLINYFNETNRSNFFDDFTAYWENKLMMPLWNSEDVHDFLDDEEAIGYHAKNVFGYGDCDEKNIPKEEHFYYIGPYKERLKKMIPFYKNSVLILMNTTFEDFFKEAFYSIFMSKPKCLEEVHKWAKNNNENISFTLTLTEILRCSTQSEAISILAEKGSSFCTRGKFENQIKKLEKLLGKENIFSANSIKVLGEVEKIRNEFVHEGKSNENFHIKDWTDPIDPEEHGIDDKESNGEDIIKSHFLRDIYYEIANIFYEKEISFYSNKKLYLKPFKYEK